MTMKPEASAMDVTYFDSGYSGAPQVVVLRMTYAFMVNYSYVVIDHNTKQALVVDPAWNMEKIEQVLASTRTCLSGILLTHAHPDHTHLAKPLAAKYHCPMWMSHEEISVSGFRDTQLIGIDTTPWSVGQIHIQPISTPGHTPGSLCYLIGDNLFTGDTLFAEGCGLCPDVRAAHMMFESLQHLKSRLKPDTHIFPGHSYGKQPGQKFSLLLKDNLYLQFKNENDFTAYRLRKGQNNSRFMQFQ